MARSKLTAKQVVVEGQLEDVCQVYQKMKRLRRQQGRGHLQVRAGRAVRVLVPRAAGKTQPLGVARVVELSAHRLVHDEEDDDDEWVASTSKLH
mmetsp:Transcript_135386/g.220252  ORF Transcript_135386/g.220252 Transcript_135386/m.220252 type:complete len:94 (+) Transcript_135386:1035-1316(+)